jgi:1-deoxy-D-xylulose 5-phosphate reductoisomerase
MKRITLLGATGSIGALRVTGWSGARFKVQ